MGLFKDQGNPELVLIEELAEVQQVIAKKLRFEGSWNEIPPGKTKTRWEELEEEMEDVMYAWKRLREKHLNDNLTPLKELKL